MTKLLLFFILVVMIPSILGSACDIYTNCQYCTSTGGLCQWCPSSSSCISTFFSTCPGATSFSQSSYCSCYNRTDCVGCQTNPTANCGWCTNNMQCQPQSYKYCSNNLLNSCENKPVTAAAWIVPIVFVIVVVAIIVGVCSYRRWRRHHYHRHNDYATVAYQPSYPTPYVTPSYQQQPPAYNPNPPAYNPNY